jgi:hypothetical protein
LAYAGHARCRLTEVITRLHTRIDVEAIGITMTADHRDRQIATVTAPRSRSDIVDDRQRLSRRTSRLFACSDACRRTSPAATPLYAPLDADPAD